MMLYSDVSTRRDPEDAVRITYEQRKKSRKAVRTTAPNSTHLPQVFHPELQL